MSPETDDEEICPIGAKKRNDAIHFVGFDKMSGYLNAVPPSFGDSGLQELLVIPLAIRFNALGHIRSNSDHKSGVCGRGSMTVLVCSGVPSSLQSSIPALSASRAAGESSYATMVF
jgi:hypothetical protein